MATAAPLPGGGFAAMTGERRRERSGLDPGRVPPVGSDPA